MPKYKVLIPLEYEQWVVVDADDEDMAIEVAHMGDFEPLEEPVFLRLGEFDWVETELIE